PRWRAAREARNASSPRTRALRPAAAATGSRWWTSTTESMLELEADPHGHLELGDAPVLDGATLLDHLEPVHVVHRPGRLLDCRLHRFGEADRGRPHHIDEFVDARHRDLLAGVI